MSRILKQKIPAKRNKKIKNDRKIRFHYKRTKDNINGGIGITKAPNTAAVLGSNLSAFCHFGGNCADQT